MTEQQERLYWEAYRAMQELYGLNMEFLDFVEKLDGCGTLFKAYELYEAANGS